MLFIILRKHINFFIHQVHLVVTSVKSEISVSVVIFKIVVVNWVIVCITAKVNKNVGE